MRRTDEPSPPVFSCRAKASSMWPTSIPSLATDREKMSHCSSSTPSVVLSCPDYHHLTSSVTDGSRFVS